MILIITHKADITADFVINKLNKKGINYKRFNCEDIFTSDLTFNFTDKLEYSILGDNSYHSVWFRRTKLPPVEGLAKDKTLYILNETDSLLRNMFAILPVKWLSSPSSVFDAENKLHQLRVAQRIGFTIPETVVTTSKDQLRKFFHDNHQDIIIKPIARTRVDSVESPSFFFTSIVGQKFIDEIEEYDLTPCLFQRNIPKEYEIRVTVVGSTVFAASVDSQSDIETKVDWRKKKLKFARVELPESVSEMCVQLLVELRLKFGAIDLIKTPDGKYVFLEINPNGQWVWIENETGQKISEAIIDFLTNNDE